MPHHAVILGGSLAGYSCAKAISRFFDKITVVERDELPSGATSRAGVPQGRHARVSLSKEGEDRERLALGRRGGSRDMARRRGIEELLIEPPEKLEAAVGPPAAPIARSVHPPARRERVIHEFLGGELGPIQVAARDTDPPDEELSCHAGRHRMKRFIQHVDARMQRLLGRSLERYRQVGERVDRLFLLFDACGRHVEVVRRAGTGLLGRPWRAARTLLDGAIVVSTTSRPEKRKLFVPGEHVETIAADRISDEIDAEFGRAVDALEELAARWRAAPEAAQALAQALDRVAAAMTRVADAKLPIAPYEDERQRLAGVLAATHELLAVDFIEAHERAAAATEDADALAERLQRAAATGARLDGEIAAALAAIDSRVAELRGAGLALREPVFNPDSCLADARQAIAAARAALLSGAVPDGAGAADRAMRIAQATLDRIAATVRGRDESPARLASLRGRIVGLRGEVSTCVELLGALATDFDPASFAQDAARFAQREEFFAQAGTLCDGAETDVGKQRYLGAADKLDRACGGRDVLSAVLAEIASRRAALERAAAETQAKSGEGAAHLSTLRELVGTNAHAISDLGAVVSLGSRHEALLGSMAAPRPNWPRLQADATDLCAAISAAHDRAGRDIAALAAATNAAAESARVVASVGAVLERERDDRLPANSRLAAARAELDQAQAILLTPHADWPRAQNQAESARALALSAEDLARQDLALAQAARVALAAARQRFASVDRYYGHEVRADVGGVTPVLASANVLMDRQEYEHALEAAERSRTMLDAAEQLAVAAVNRLEEERRMAASLQSHSWLSSSSMSSSSSSSSTDWTSSSFSSSHDTSSSSSGTSYSGSDSSGTGY